MGRKESKRVFRVLCVKDDKVYYIQLNKDGKRSKHYFKNPIPYEKYLKEKHSKAASKNMLTLRNNSTETREPSKASDIIQNNSSNLQNTHNNFILKNPAYEIDRRYFYDPDDSDETEYRFEFDAESLHKSQLPLEGTICTYDSTAFYNTDQT